MWQFVLDLWTNSDKIDKFHHTVSNTVDNKADLWRHISFQQLQDMENNVAAICRHKIVAVFEMELIRPIFAFRSAFGNKVMNSTPNRGRYLGHKTAESP